MSYERVPQFGGGGSSSTSSAPLLQSAQTPAGTYSRIADNMTPNAQQPYGNGPNMGNGASMRYGPSAGNPTMARPGPGAPGNGPVPPRYGPSASSPSTSSHGGNGGGMNNSSLKAAGAGAGAGPMLGMDDADLDDQLHTFTPADRKDLSTPFRLNSWRGWANALTLFVLLAGFVVLFAGYPIIDWYYDTGASVGRGASGYGLGGINGTGQTASIANFPQLIDPDTPDNAMTHVGYDKSTWNLVFSDEFNKDGRTFYEGDDPFFTAVDIHYWPTNDFEWYDPSAVSTRNGNLVITMTQQPINGLMFKSGMIQSWNKLCFNKNAYFEVRVRLPGTPKIGGFWPGIWTMGNLGRAGYGGTTEGMWPYSYSSCDVGIMPNQTTQNKTWPEVALTTGDPSYGGSLSYLPGQRLPSCVCPGSDHPGPEGVGRGAVEIDIIEAQMDLAVQRGVVSQSAQYAPYDDHYQFLNTTEGTIIYNEDITKWNTYLGSVFQQAVSGLSYTDTAIYSNASRGDDYGVFGYEYVSDYSDSSKGYITWINMGERAWTMLPAAVGPNPRSKVGQRLISQEPMYLIFNLGMSNNFEKVDFAHLMVPNEMLIDYIRVYQRPDGEIGCDPDDRPTAAYIEKYKELYHNPNITLFIDPEKGRAFPPNKLTTGC